MQSSFDTIILSAASLITFAAFGFLYAGVHQNSIALSAAGIGLVGVSAILPLALAFSKRGKKNR